MWKRKALRIIEQVRQKTAKFQLKVWRNPQLLNSMSGWHMAHTELLN